MIENNPEFVYSRNTFYYIYTKHIPLERRILRLYSKYNIKQYNQM